MAVPTVLRANDGYKVVVNRQRLFAVWGTSDIKMFDTSVYKSASVPDAIFTPDIMLGSSTGWTDMDVEVTGTRVWAVGTLGLTVATYNASSGLWPYVTYTRIPALSLVAVAPARDVVYAATLTSVYAFDPVNNVYFNGASPIATVTAGSAWRGIAAVPWPASPTSTSTATVTSTGSQTSTPTTTSSSSASASITPSQTPSQSLGSRSSTPSPSITPSQTSSASVTSSWTATASPTMRPGFGTLGFAAVRLTNPGAAYSSTSMPLQTVFIDDYSDCVDSPACLRWHSWSLPASGAGACTLPPQVEAGRLSRSANNALLSLYCVRNASGTVLGATFDSDGVAAMISSDGTARTDFLLSKLRMQTSGIGADYGIGATLIPNSVATEDGSNAWSVGDRASGAQGWLYWTNGGANVVSLVSGEAVCECHDRRLRSKRRRQQ